MKRLVALLSVLCILVFLSACEAEQTPFEKCRDKVIDIGEQYLNFEITAEEAKTQLEAIKVPETDLEHGQWALEFDIRQLVRLISDDETTYEEIAEQVEDLKTSILLY